MHYSRLFNKLFKKYAMQILQRSHTHIGMHIEEHPSRKLHCAVSVDSNNDVDATPTSAADNTQEQRQQFNLTLRAQRSLTLSRLHIARVLRSSFCHELELHVEGVQVFSTAHCLVAGVFTLVLCMRP